MARSTPTLDFLTPKQLKCLAMFYFDGMTQSEIAEALGIDQSRVARHIKRGREKLAKRRMRPHRVERVGGPKLWTMDPSQLDRLGPDDVKARW